MTICLAHTKVVSDTTLILKKFIFYLWKARLPANQCTEFPEPERVSPVVLKRAKDILEAAGQPLKWPVGLPDPATAFWSYLGDLALNNMMPLVIFSSDPPVMGGDGTDLAGLSATSGARRHGGEEGSKQQEPYALQLIQEEGDQVLSRLLSKML